MPIYEYECKACGHRMEKLQKISADPLTHCPACERDALARLVSAAGFRLAGGGWYETDFKTGGKKNLAAQSQSGSAGNTESGSTNGGGAKSDASKAKESSSNNGSSNNGSSKNKGAAA